MNAANLPDLLGTEDKVLLLDALLSSREHGVPRAVLEAEFEHVAEWARNALCDMAMLELVRQGRIAISVVEGELTFHAIEAAR